MLYKAVLITLDVRSL